MFQRIISIILLVSFVLFECGCYTLKSYSPQEVKPEWEIAYVVKKDSSEVRFDEEDPGTIQRNMVVGGVRNDFAEIRQRKVPMDSIAFMRVRRLDTSARMLIVAGVGAGIATFLLIEAFNQHRNKGANGGIANGGSE